MSVAPTEQRPALGATPPLPAPARGAAGGGDLGTASRRLVRADALWWVTLLTAGLACLVTFLAKGGLNLESMTTTEIVLTLASGVAVAVAVVLTPAARSLIEGPKYGLWPVALLIAFTALSGLSVVWSVQPDVSWQDAGRLLAYSGVFGAAVALVRLAPDRWPAILGGLTLAATIVCSYALATKVFPGRLAPAVTYARLEEPYGYWNAIGLTAAMGAIGCMWLGARRAGHALLSALAYPAMGVMGVTLMLAYSRGALVALAIGVALWLCIVPLRLRGAAVLMVGGLGAGAVVVWDFSRHALTTDNIPLAQRATAGHQLGVLLVVMVLLLTLAGVAIGFLWGRRPLSRTTRTRAGAILLALIALALVGLAGALAHSHRGFTGSISHTVDTLTNPNAKVPPNSPGRLTAVASVRARYWKQALQVFDAHPTLGAGAAGYETASLRYRTVLLEVKHAHGFAVQTLADLGAVGLALALALLFAWMAAAGRATHPFNRRWTSWRAWLDLRAGRASGLAALAPAIHSRAYRHAQHVVPGGRVRRALAGGLDLVRAGRRVRGAAVRRLARRPRPAGRVQERLRPHPRMVCRSGEDDARQTRPGDERSVRVDTTRRSAHAGGIARRLGNAPATVSARDRPDACRCGHRRDSRRAAGGLVAVAAPALGQRLTGSARAADRKPPRRPGQGTDCRRARSTVGAGADRARGRPADRGRARAGDGDATARGAAATIEPADVARAGPARSRKRTGGRAEGAAGGDLSEPRVDRP